MPLSLNKNINCVRSGIIFSFDHFYIPWIRLGILCGSNTHTHTCIYICRQTRYIQLTYIYIYMHKHICIYMYTVDTNFCSSYVLFTSQENWISKYWATEWLTAPRGNTGRGSCDTLITHFCQPNCYLHI